MLTFRAHFDVLLRLEQPAAAERVEAQAKRVVGRAADDDVVDQLDLHDLSRLPDFPGDGAVGG